MCHWKKSEEEIDIFLCLFLRHSNEQRVITHLNPREDAIHHKEREQLVEIPVITDKELVEEGLVVNKGEMARCQEFVTEIMSTSIR